MSRRKSSGTETTEKTQLLESIGAKKLNRRTFLKATAGTAAAAGAVVIALEVDTSAQSAAPTSGSSMPPASDPFAVVPITLNVNGKPYKTVVEPRDMLVNVLREHFNLTGTKRPCNRQECGGCTVLIDNQPVYACTFLALRAQGHSILTTEGASSDKVLAALQQAWIPADASQCGFCQAGRLMAATALLKSNPNPSVDEIKAAIQGVLCRCGTYMNGITAIQNAAKILQGASS